MAGSPVAGALPVYSGSGDTWVPSGSSSSGIIFATDYNTICFPQSVSNMCDINVEWNGVDLTFNGPFD
jgi:hypothetical protein